MKIRPAVLSACFGGLLIFPEATRAAAPADTQWAEIEQLVQGPKTRPTSQEEAKEMMKANVVEFEAKAAAFREANPNDPRRWKLAVHEIQRNRMAEMVGRKAKSPEEIAKLCADVINAPDADATTKGAASFYRAASAQSNPQEFARLVEIHLKEYPEFAGNKRLEEALKAKEAPGEANPKTKQQ